MYRLQSGHFLASIALLATAPAMAGRIEAGSFNTIDTFGSPIDTAVTFSQTFDTVPVVVALSDINGGDPAWVRVINVTTTGFDALILEPQGRDGPHVTQNVHYIALEPGRHVLPGGQVIEAGFVDTAAVQFGPGVGGTASWTPVSFSMPLLASSVVVTHLQTNNSEVRNPPNQSTQPSITALSTSATSTGFNVALERSQANNGTVLTETVGWIAFPQGQSGSFRDVSNNLINWGASLGNTNIRGWSNGCFTSTLPVTGAGVIAIAKKTTRNNNDGGWLRRCSLNATTIGLRNDEDTAQDNERGVPGGSREQAAIIAFSQAFHANLRPIMSVDKTHTAVDDQLGSDFHLPGAMIDYQVVVSNSGTSPPSYEGFTVVEIVPPGLDFVVDDFGAAGSGPVEFTDGSPGSGMTYNYVSLADTGDSLSFSTDGSDFSYVPTPDANGTDPAITHVRIIPSGFFANDNGGATTSFTLRFRARIE